MANTLKFGNGEWYGKKDTILAYNDENNNYKPLPFDFSRGSTPSGSKATTINKDGLIETVGNNVPRIDYKDNSKGALLLEPSRSNLITYSEDFSQSYWNKSGGIIISSNSTTSIDGTLNATKINGANSYSSVFIPSTTVLNGVKYTYSVFVKKNISSKLALRAMTTGNDTRVVFNLDDLSTNISEGYDTGYDSSSIEVYSNGWYRCILTITTATTSLRLNIYPDSPPNVSSQSGVYIYGAQLEQGSYATSYIPTSGQANGVTRVADVCSNGANDQVINSTEGVLYFEGNSIANDGTFKRISIGTSDNVFANSIQLRYNAVDNSITYQFRVGNVYQADLTITANTTNVNKIACVWKINRFEIWVNGVKQAEDTSGSVPSSNTFNSLFFGKSSNALLEPFKGNIKDIKLYDTALTDQELIALTTI